MYLYGSFITQYGETVTVHILTEKSRAVQVEIGDENGGLFFTTNPVEIQSSVNDTFDHLLRSQATIRLLTRDFIPDLFCTSCRDAVVNIYKGDKCIFAGFVEPQTYSQGYNEVYDEIEISCIDVLSALQYSKYREVGSVGVSYEEVKANADQLSFAEIIDSILGRVCESIDIIGAQGAQFFYDGSKALNENANRYDIFSKLAISELLFLGEEEDNVWQQDDVLTAMLKYLNLHIVQEGLQFYIFSWESVKGQAPISWRELTSGEAVTTSRICVKIDTSNAASTDTTISIGEVFNQILLTCRIESIENIVKSPLDDDALTSPYSKRQKYMTEYSVDGKGGDAYHAFFAMTHGNDTNYSDGAITDWYLQVMDNPMWIFPDVGSGINLIEKYCQNNANQQQLPNRMAESPGAAILSLGKIIKKTDQKDNYLSPE